MKSTTAPPSKRQARTPTRSTQETPQQLQKRLRRILKTLAAFPTERGLELDFTNPYQLLVATILSAQCTDERVNQVTPKFFKRYATPQSLASASQQDVERLIFSTGFYKAKAKNLIRCATHLKERFGGEVPQSMEILITLPGVGRKTANVLRGNAFHLPAIVVDTHVKRVAQRLNLVHRSDPDSIEEELQHLMPQSQWTQGSQHLLLHGRYVCLARRPKCSDCPIATDCPWEEKSLR